MRSRSAAPADRGRRGAGAERVMAELLHAGGGAPAPDPEPSASRSCRQRPPETCACNHSVAARAAEARRESRRRGKSSTVPPSTGGSRSRRGKMGLGPSRPQPVARRTGSQGDICMRIARTFLAALLALLALGAAAQADVLDDIKKRGTLIVGVKPDYKPFGFRDPSGALIGIEPDLAADVAKKLGVKLELVPVLSANRMEFLNQGKIDLMIATMSDKPERRKVVQVIEPLYYSDSVNILLRKDAPVKSWEDLKGKKLCGTTGAFYNFVFKQKTAYEIASFDGSEKPLLALKNGDCIGYL